MTTILGHDTVLEALRHSAAQDRLAHAYLLVGPDGVGKRLVASWFAQLLHCTAEEAARPCGTCVACAKTERRQHPDGHWLEEGETATIKIEQVRTIIERLGLRPYEGRRAVAVIDPAEGLTDDAANALLKTLEEPRGEAVVILVTTDASRCLPTLVSRCRLVRFGALAPSLIEQHLIQHSLASKEEARQLVLLADGSLGRAIGLAQSGAVARRREALAMWRSPASLIEDRHALRESLAHLIWWTREELLQQARTPARDAKPLAALLDDLLALHEAADQHANARLVSALVHSRLAASGLFESGTHRPLATGHWSLRG